MGDHGQLRAEALDVLGLAFEEALGDEQREVRIDRARCLDPLVHLGLHVLPDRVPVGPDDHRAAHQAALCELRLVEHVLVPLRKVFGLWGEDGGLAGLGRHRAVRLPSATELLASARELSGYAIDFIASTLDSMTTTIAICRFPRLTALDAIGP